MRKTSRHIRLVGEYGSGHPYTAKELKWGNNPEFAVQQYDRIVSRWCFPEPRFVGSVVYVLYNIMCQCLKWAQLEKGKGDRYAGTEWTTGGKSCCFEHFISACTNPISRVGRRSRGKILRIWRIGSIISRKHRRRKPRTANSPKTC